MTSSQFLGLVLVILLCYAILLLVIVAKFEDSQHQSDRAKAEILAAIRERE